MKEAILWPENNMVHEYEMVVVTGADGSDADRKNQIDEIKKIIEAEKSEIVDVNDWGKRELAYPIKKQSHGHYSLVTFKGNPNTPQAIKSKINLDEAILRYMVVRTEEEKVKSRGKKK